MLRRSYAVVLVLCVAVSAAFAQKRPVTAEDYYNIKSVSNPALSPDGAKVAFTVMTAREEENDRISRIWMVDLAGGEPYPFTTPDRSSTNPRWSEDGDYLIFTSNRGGRNRTWHLNMKHGGEAFYKEDYKATGNRSKDKRYVLITKRVGMEPEPEEQEKDDFDGRIIEHRSYKANGRGFIPPPVDRGGISQIHKTTWEAVGDTTQLTFDDLMKSSAVWSADDRFVVYTAAPDQRNDDGEPLEFLDRDWRNETFVISSEGGSPRKLDMPEGSVRGITFAKNSNRFFYGHSDGRFNDTFYYVYDLETDKTVRIGKNWIYGMGSIEWSPDDRWIYFSAGIGGSTHLCRIPSDGSGDVEQITRGYFQYGSFQFNEDMTMMVYTKTSSMMPGELFTANIDGSNERQLSNINKDFLEEVYISPVTRHVIKGKGGFEIEGWLVEPFGYQSGRKYPMVLQIHGGPHSRYGDTFFHQFHVLAGQGMYVLFTNPRGSGGYGHKFTYITREKWGVDDYDDLMRFTDYAIENADIDPQRLGVAGGSYGGFMTNWITTQTDRFAAAASSRTIVNWLSFFGTSDAQGLIVNEFGLGFPWEEKVHENMWKYSPIAYVERVKTPTLIIQSEEDYRTPMGDAEQWFQALKILKVPTRFVRYPRENHNLSRTGEPNHLVHRLSEITNWFNQYLNSNFVESPPRQ
ncbi:S9 family peptidase [candidate division KSB1 bacterium]